MDDQTQRTKGQSASFLAEELERARYRERSLETALIRSLEEIRSLRSSPSWRITRPLRLFSKAMRRKAMRRVRRLMRIRF